MTDEVRRPRRRVSKTIVGETRTKQAFKDQTNINDVVRRYAQTGMWDHLQKREPQFGDFSLSADLKTAIDRVRGAEDDFNSLPAAVRKVADNNPVKFLELLAEEDTARELQAAGLPINLPEKAPEAKPEEAAGPPPSEPPEAPAPTETTGGVTGGE